VSLLEPYTKYEMWVRAFTSKHEGKPSEPLAAVYTDVRAPGRPDIVSLVCQSGTTMFLKWVRPAEFYRTVDVYYVLYRGRRQPPPPAAAAVESAAAEEEWEEQVVETVNNTINHMVSKGSCIF
jgi:hypothetical protein